MKNPFKTAGFDSIIAKGMTISGIVSLAQGSVTVLDGIINGEKIRDTFEVIPVGNDTGTTLIVNGVAQVDAIDLPNLTIHGAVSVQTLMIMNILAIKKGGSLNAKKIYYNTLVIETGANVQGELIQIGSAGVTTEHA